MLSHSTRPLSLQFGPLFGVLAFLCTLAAVWTTQSGIVREWIPGAAETSPLDTLMIGMLALPLVLFQCGSGIMVGSDRRVLALVAAMAVAAASLWLLIESSFPSLAGAVWIFSGVGGQPLFFLERPGVLTLTAVLMAAIAFLFSTSQRRLARWAVNAYGLSLLAISWIILFGYAARSNPLFLFSGIGSDPFSALNIPLPAAVCLLFISASLLGTLHQDRLSVLFGSDNNAASLLRHLLPLALLLPLLLTWLIVWTLEYDPTRAPTAVVLAMALTSFGFAACVFWMADSLRKREALLVDLEETNRNLQEVREEMLIVCAWTHQVLDGGEWVCFDDYMMQHHGIAVSHGISEEALKEQMKSLEKFGPEPDQGSGIG